MTQIVFIYGTLKRGFPFHEQGLVGARMLGEVETVHPYPLYVAGPFFGPMMLDKAGEGLRVRGELYEVEDDWLPVLDALEAVGEPGSFRSTIEVMPLGGGGIETAIAFFKFRRLVGSTPVRLPGRLPGQAVRSALGAVNEASRVQSGGEKGSAGRQCFPAV